MGEMGSLKEMAKGWVNLKSEDWLDRKAGTIRGYDVKILLRGVMLYIRRGDEKMGCRCVVDLHHVCWIPDFESRRLFKELIRTLKTSFIEDVASASPHLLNWVNRQLWVMQAVLDGMWPPAVTFTEEQAIASYLAAVSLVNRMARSEHARSPLHVEAVYLGSGTLHKTLVNERYAETLGVLYTTGAFYVAPSDEDFTRMVHNRDNRAFSLAYKIVQAHGFQHLLWALDVSCAEKVVLKEWHDTSGPKQKRRLVVLSVLMYMDMVGKSSPVEEEKPVWKELIRWIIKDERDPLHSFLDLKRFPIDASEARMWLCKVKDRVLREDWKVGNESECVVPLFKRFYRDYSILRIYGEWNQFEKITGKRKQMEPDSVHVAFSWFHTLDSKKKK